MDTWRVDEEQLRALEDLVLAVFDAVPSIGQPRYLADMACGDGRLLERLYGAIQRRSRRGQMLDALPLTLVGVERVADALGKAGERLARFNAVLVPGDWETPATVVSELHATGIARMDDVLWISASAPPGMDADAPVDHLETDTCAAPDAETLAAWKPFIGANGMLVAVRQRAGGSGSISALLDRMAAEGLFPQPEHVYRKAESPEYPEGVVYHFMRRDYRVRTARKSDMAALMDLEGLCWPAGQRAPANTIAERLAQFPNGQLVIELDDGTIAAALYCQRLSGEDVDGADSNTVHRRHQTDGAVAHVLALNVRPELQHLSLGDQLLEFALQRAAVLGGVEKVIGVTRCKDYPKHRDQDLAQYIHRTNERSRLVDPVLRLHQLHGAEVVRLVSGYRPQDLDNDGNGVLVRYDLRERRRRMLAAQALHLVGQSGVAVDGDVAGYLRQLVGEVLDRIDPQGVPLDQPLFELGLDSADLLDLGERIRAVFLVDLEPAFFFEHNTCGRIASFLCSQPLRKDLAQTSVVEQVPTSPANIVTVANASSPTESRDVAIIGVACRLPGGIADVRSFWQMLEDGRSAISVLPQNRWCWPDYVDAAGEHLGIDYGGFLDDIRRFDAALFRISPREAALLDPQQRLLLELSWACLEDAGYAKRDVAGSATGVFVGASGSDYQLRLASEDIEIDAHFGLGTSMAVLANRLSYFYDWCGPSIQIDTACSSSLVAVHEAVKALRSGECTQALVAGVSLMCHPAGTISFFKAGMLAPDGRCKTFDKSANGYVRGEGAVALLLKPLAQAIEDGDRIYGLIKGSAANHGGQAAGLTVPNPARQAELVRAALADADVDPATVGYVEAHGTGTALGDPIEVRGLKQAFAPPDGDGPRGFCGLGSVKTNLGHLEAAAGITGLLKVLLCFQHGRLPASLHFQELNQHISLAGSPFYVVACPRPWDPSPGQAMRRAGVSSFGSGGANAHVVLEEYLEPDRSSESAELAGSQGCLIVISAKNADRLRARVEGLLAILDRGDLRDVDLYDLAFTLQVGRESMDARLGLEVANTEALARELRAWLRGECPAAVIEGQAARTGEAVDSMNLLNAYLERGDGQRLLRAWVAGGDLDWRPLWSGQSRRRLPLPTYPFAGKAYWLPADPTATEANLVSHYQEPVAPSPQTQEAVHPAAPDRAVRLRQLSDDISLPTRGEAGTAPKVKLQSLVPEPPGAPVSAAAIVSHDPATTTAFADSAELSQVLRVLLAEALYLQPEDVALDEQFTDMGLDSISGVEWVRAVNMRFGTRVSATMVYAYPNIRAFAGYFAAECTTPTPGAASSTANAGPGQMDPGSVRDTSWEGMVLAKQPREASAPDELRAALTRLLADALYLVPGDISPDEQFTDMGLDSISGVEWVRAVNMRFGTRVSATMVYAYPNIRAFADYLLGEIGQAAEQPAQSAPVAVPGRPPDKSTKVMRVLTPAVPPSCAAADAETARRLDDRPRSSIAKEVQEAVAIVGMSGRYPGASDLGEYWANLLAGRSAIKEVPRTRWDVEKYYDPRPYMEGKVASKWLGLLDGVDLFDPLFFGISPAEAEVMDPQQRLFLQEAYRALEHAGYGPQVLNKSNCGVYLGISNNEYAHLLRHGGPGIADRIGNSAAIAAARIAYYLNLRGPAIAVDTACSSSLVATHLARQALLNREVDLVLVGGISLYLTPELYLNMSSAGMLSPDGRCKAFDNSANGIVPGEGVGVLVLKRLSAAEADGDTIYGVIAASGINQDGKTNGITAPNLESQRELVTGIYSKHAIDPASISFVEMHGTGTKLGDPIELEALCQAFRRQTDQRHFCAIGSVKNNIGHTSAAAGVASVHKVLLSLLNRQIPPTVNFTEPNEHFDFSSSPFYVNTRPLAWQSRSEPRRAAVSSFGISGTNAHVVIEEYAGGSTCDQAVASGTALIVLSARTTGQLREYVESLSRYLAEHPHADLREVASTLQVGRKPMAHRLAVITDSRAELQQALQGFLSGRSAAHVHVGNVVASETPFKLLEADADADILLRAWIQKGQLQKIATLWVNGIDVDWRLLHGAATPRRIGLPSYPFARESYWVPAHQECAPGSPERRDLVADAEPPAQFEAFALAKIRCSAQTESADFETLLLRTLWAQLRAAGWFTAGSSGALADSTATWGIAPLYERWMQEAVTRLSSAGFLDYDGISFAVPEGHEVDVQSAWEAWDVQVRARGDALGLQAQLALAGVTLRALVDILTGKCPATQVMFPGGAVDMVGNVYKHSRIGQYINGNIGTVIADHVKRLVRKDPSARVRIIEIGAGTGGTSRAVFGALAPLQCHISEYQYTDVSRGFLLHAEEEFGTENPFLRYGVFDVETAPAGQGIEAGAYDLAVAANVLHATRDIRRTLAHVQQVLKPGGVLLLNEMCGNSLFRHLTFGLLEGWWRYQDDELRIRNCPGLEPAMWEKALAQSGFHDIRFPAQAVHDLGYQLIVARRADTVSATTVRPTALREGAADGVASRASVIPGVAEKQDVSADAGEVESHVRQAVARALKIDAETVEPDLPFADYGVDSITGVRLVRLINVALGVDLPTTVLFDYSTLRKLTIHIATAYPLECCRQAPAAVSAAAAPRSGSEAPVQVLGAAVDSSGSVVLKQAGRSFSQDPIAVIGMSGRFAGSEGVWDLWDHLAHGRDLVEKVSRWDPYPDAVSSVQRDKYCTQGSFLEGIDEFDPLFFSISALEATYMDPAQRLFMQEAWRALEDGGYVGPSIRGRRCGVYVGAVAGDYRELVERAAPAQAMLGTASSMVAARISYHLDLQGPAVVVDTACSSSLVAIHLACQGLWTGEAELALAGGVFVQSTARFYKGHNRAGMLSPTGRCHTFDERADGFVFGEGVGAVLLKPLAKAMADGDHIYGVIRGSGINQDGATNGISAPSAKSQERLECDVYDRFGIDPSSIQLIEAHGTGTKLGDPIEYQALTSAFRRYTDKVGFCAIGSIKTNIGHAAHAAGIAGFIKLMLAITRKEIPASLHYRQGNSHIRFEGSPFFVNTQLRRWDADPGQPRRAAVSAFGLSGTNAHIVVEEAPYAQKIQVAKPGHLIALSAKSAEQLRRQVKNLLDYVGRRSDADLANMSFTLLTGRSHFGHRLACVVRDQPDLCHQLAGWLRGESGSSKLAAAVPSRRGREVPSPGEAGNLISELRHAHTSTSYLSLLMQIVELHLKGCDIDFEPLFSGGSYSRMPLPTYPFARERYWVKDPSPVADQISGRDGHEEDQFRDSLIGGLTDGSIGVEEAVAMAMEWLSA